MKKVVIAIDGPAAAGKSTVSKIVAKKLGYTYIDTGAMYRAFTEYVLRVGVNPENEVECNKLIPDVHIELFPNGTVICSGKDVTKEIREPHVSRNVSYIASYKEIRLAMVDQQRKMAEKVSVVMDGRDIGTYVLPNADVKIYQVASVEERASRRFKEIIAKGQECDLEQLKQEIAARDKADSEREISPLKQADDAVLLDSSDMTIDEVVQTILKMVEERL